MDEERTRNSSGTTRCTLSGTFRNVLDPSPAVAKARKGEFRVILCDVDIRRSKAHLESTFRLDHVHVVSMNGFRDRKRVEQLINPSLPFSNADSLARLGLTAPNVLNNTYLSL